MISAPVNPALNSRCIGPSSPCPRLRKLAAADADAKQRDRRAPTPESQEKNRTWLTTARMPRYSLGDSMAWDSDPKQLLRGSFALAALTASFSLAGLWDQRGFPVAGALTALAGFLAGYRAWAIEHLRRLSPTQRATLVEQLRRALMTCGSRWDVPLV